MSWLTAVAPASVRPETTARIVANATALTKPFSTPPPTASARNIATILLLPGVILYAAFWPTMLIAAKPMMKVRM